MGVISSYPEVYNDGTNFLISRLIDLQYKTESDDTMADIQAILNEWDSWRFRKEKDLTVE